MIWVLVAPAVTLTDPIVEIEKSGGGGTGVWFYVPRLHGCCDARQSSRNWMRLRIRQHLAMRADDRCQSNSEVSCRYQTDNRPL